MADEKKIWVVQVDVRTADLENNLNKLADDSYTMHSIVRAVNDTWTVVAYDAARIMEKSTAAMVKQLTDLQGPQGKPAPSP